MRQGQHSRRPRTRGRRPQNSNNRVFDSNGPEVKVRGTAATVAEKYVSLSHDAHSQGDRVKAENLMQHAEHYLRIAAAAKEQKQQSQPQPQQADPSPQAQAHTGENNADGEQPAEAAKGTPRVETLPRRRRARPPRPQSEVQDTVAKPPKPDAPEASDKSGEVSPAEKAAPDDAGGVAA